MNQKANTTRRKSSRDFKIEAVKVSDRSPHPKRYAMLRPIIARRQKVTIE
ncbi:MAG: hypothetical protein ING08_20630 [Roseomonas sp.]|nr:hypothetical protein [Roseomonas sp.]